MEKKTAWSTRNAFPEISPVFEKLTAEPECLNDSNFILIQRFVILMYDRTSDVGDINECRKVLFTKKTRSIENIPPTKAALLQHCNSSIYQGGIIWGKSLVGHQTLPSRRQVSGVGRT